MTALAEDLGIRALLIKGPTLQLQGLRLAHTSADTDLLVEPNHFVEMCDAILAGGWDERPNLLIGELTTRHSRTFLRDGWPCDIDVHSFFPGFLNDPAAVFDSLWSARTTLDFAHQSRAVTSRAGSALILALHSLRGTEQQDRHAAELDYLHRVEFSNEERAAIATLAQATGCVATLSEVLPRLGVVVEPSASELAAPELREWRERIDSGSFGAYFWLLAFRHTRGADKARILWRAVWPTDHDLLVARPEIVDAFWSKMRGRADRFGRGIRSLPRAVRAIWKNRARGNSAH